MQETINEATVLLASLSLFYYTDMLVTKQRYLVGWGTIGIIAINITINLTFMSYVTILSFKLRCKKLQLRYVARKRAE